MPFASMSNETSISGSPLARGRDLAEHELAEQVVLVGALALALEHADLHRALVVARGREHVRLAHGHRGVALDQRREVAVEGGDAERERRHVEQQHVALARRRAGCPARRRRARPPRRGSRRGAAACRRSCVTALLDQRHARLAADEHDVVDLARVDRPASVDALRDALHRLLDDVADQLVERLARELQVEVARAARAVRDERQVDLGGLRATRDRTSPSPRRP